MKALVLSGGAGTRPGPITRTSAKQLAPVACKPVPFCGSESLADAFGDGSKSCPRATRIPQGNPPGAAHAVLIAPAVRYPVDSRADVRRTAVQGHWKDTGNVDDPLEVDRCVRTLLASDAPRGTASAVLTCAGTLDNLELEHLRPESAHGDGHDPRCSVDRTEARDEFGHRPRHDFAAGLAETVARHRDHPTGPRTAHGRSELAGERAGSEEPPGASAVVRTPWLYGLHGADSVRTMIGLEPHRPTVDVVDDQRGQPTRSADVAERTAGLGARLGDGAYGPPPARDRKSAQREVLPLIRKELSQ